MATKLTPCLSNTVFPPVSLILDPCEEGSLLLRTGVNGVLCSLLPGGHGGQHCPGAPTRSWPSWSNAHFQPSFLMGKDSVGFQNFVLDTVSAFLRSL